MPGTPPRTDTAPQRRGLQLSGSCQVCRAWAPGRLCGDCVTAFAPPAARCVRCGLRVGAGVPCCGDCLRDPPPFEHTRCAVDYAFPWDRVITGFKFGGQDDLATALADLMLQAAGAPATPMPDLFVPVPLSRERLAARGYNQAWELARRVAAGCGRPAVGELLQRGFDAAPQSALPRAERLRHLRGAFAVHPRHGARMAGRHVALVDDVMTTGATAREAASVLRSAGAARVDLWVLARTPA